MSTTKDRVHYRVMVRRETMKIREDYSYLFSGFNNNNNNNDLFNGIDLSDYVSIKNGSYGKALKSYYREINQKNSNLNSHSTGNSSSNSTVKKPEISIDSTKKEEITGLQSSVSSLKDSANRLLKKGSSSVFQNSDKEAIYKEVSNFVSNLNSLVEKGSGSSFDYISRISKRMLDTVKDNETALGEIGISLKGGKLAIDKDTFMKADIEQVKSLFNEANSFADFVSKRTQIIEESVANVARRNNIDIEAIKKEQQSTLGNSTISGSSNKTDNSVDTARKEEMTKLQKEAEGLENTVNKLLARGSSSLFKAEYEQEDKEALYKAVSDFVTSYNLVYEKGKSVDNDSLVNMAERLNDTTNDFRDELKAIGISVEEKKLSIDKDTFMNADFGKAKKLFNETNSYGYFVSQRAEMIEGVAKSEANRNNLYTKEGIYNNSLSGTLYTGNM